MKYDMADKWLKNRMQMPTALSSKGLEGVAPAIKAMSFFSSRVAQGHVLDRLREVSDAYTRGELDLATARMKLKNAFGTKYEPGSEEDSQMERLCSTARLNLILRQNARMAMAVGEYQQGMDEDMKAMFPYWRYVASTSASPRSEHQKYAGKVFSKEDKIWQHIFPPWDFNCKCSVEEVAADEVEPEEVAPHPEWDDEKDAPKSGYVFNPADALGTYDPSLIKDEELQSKVIDDMKKKFGCMERQDGKLDISGKDDELDKLSTDDFIKRFLDAPVQPYEYDDEEKEKLQEYISNKSLLENNMFMPKKEQTQLLGLIEQISNWLLDRKVEKICNLSNLKEDNRSKIEYEVKDKKLKDRVDKAVMLFQKMIPKSLVEGAGTFKFARKTNERASFSLIDGFIRIDEKSTLLSIFHEMMHHIEQHNTYVHNRCIDFLIKRTTKNEKRTKLINLREVTKNKNYNENEFAWKDDFIDLYCGKRYIDNNGNIIATEILSKGIEFMLNMGEVEFRKRDPEYFALMYGLLRGHRNYHGR